MLTVLIIFFGFYSWAQDSSWDSSEKLLLTVTAEIMEAQEKKCGSPQTNTLLKSMESDIRNINISVRKEKDKLRNLKDSLNTINFSCGQDYSKTKKRIETISRSFQSIGEKMEANHNEISNRLESINEIFGSNSENAKICFENILSTEKTKEWKNNLNESLGDIRKGVDIHWEKSKSLETSLAKKNKNCPTAIYFPSQNSAKAYTGSNGHDISAGPNNRPSGGNYPVASPKPEDITAAKELPIIETIKKESEAPLAALIVDTIQKQKASDISEITDTNQNLPVEAPLFTGSAEVEVQNTFMDLQNTVKNEFGRPVRKPTRNQNDIYRGDKPLFSLIHDKLKAWKKNK